VLTSAQHSPTLIGAGSEKRKRSSERLPRSKDERFSASVLGLPHSDTRDVTVSGPLVYYPHLTSKNGHLLTKMNFFFYKFSVFEISCIQVYLEVLSKVTPRKREREWQDNINWNEKNIYPAPTQNAGARVMPLSGASTPLSPPPRR
jgi:hypothetical protein